MKLTLSVLFLFLISQVKAEGPGMCIKQPLNECSRENPCEDRIVKGTDIPNCMGDQLGIVKRSGSVERYFCQFSPKGFGKKPLVIFLHGGSGNAFNLYGSTDLRTKAKDRGFHLLSIQSRNVNIDFGNLKDGRHHDSYYSKWEKDSRNADVADMDLIIKKMVDRGDVNPRQIYLIGWSEGALFSQMYSIMRENIKSPYGHRVAAVVAYTGTSPYDREYRNNIRCQNSLKFTTKLPILLMGRDCDAAACSEDQRGIAGWSDTVSMDSWFSTLKGTLNNNEAKRVVIDSEGKIVLGNKCLPKKQCDALKAIKNHLTWPKNQEDLMIEFLFKKIAPLF